MAPTNGSFPPKNEAGNSELDGGKGLEWDGNITFLLLFFKNLNCLLILEIIWLFK